MNEAKVMKETGRQGRHTVQLTVALVLFVAVIYGVTFVKLPVWLPALK